MLDQKLNDLQKQRQEKLHRIKESGINPYPQPNLENKQSCSQASDLLGKKVTVAGRLMSLRGHGRILFADLHDRTGKIQLFFQEKILGKEKMKQTEFLDLGDIATATGEVIKTQAGELTINVDSFELLAKNLRPLPEKWHGLKDVEDRYRQRYVDLIMSPDVRKVFETRTKILSEMRRFLDDHGFQEVETPILQPVYGGASAKPFITHHNTLEMDMYLRISDELYLKRLIVGGLEKVYEVSRDFRNEGVSRFHNPEFTQIEFYWAYVDYDVLMKFTEELITHLIKLIKGDLTFSFQGQNLDFTPPFKRITFRDVILEKTKIDIDAITSIEQFKDVIEDNNLKLDLNNIVGLGECFDTLYKEYVRPTIIEPTYVTDYPAVMIALAKRKENDPQKIASFQLLAAGTELLKAYNELNDPQDQYNRWLEEEALMKKGSETAMQMDYDYIRALEYGMPPTSGWGMGIDRFAQFLTDQSTIKDVIFFPSMKNESNILRDNQENIGLQNERIVIGEIIDLKLHPNADKLQLCQIKISEAETLQIVCGATNISVGDIVPVSLVGAQVYDEEHNPMEIKVAKLRGIESHGMLCSARELGLGSDHDGIYLLPKNLVEFLGKPVKEHHTK